MLGRALANKRGQGRHAFEFDLDDPLIVDADCVVRVFREADGMDIPGSPKSIAPPRAFDDEARRRLSKALWQFDRERDLASEIDFLVDETAKLMLRLADRGEDRVRRRRHADYVRRWRWRMPASGGESEAPPAPVRRALVVDESTPMVNHDAGANALLGHVRSLRRLGFEVAFAASREFDGRPRGDPSGLGSIGVVSYAAPYYSLIEDVMARQAGEVDLVYLHRMDNGYRYGALARDYFPRARLIYSVADLHHLRLARQAAAEDRPELAAASRAARGREWVATMMADSVVTHSSLEASLLARVIPAQRVHVVTWPIPPRPVATPFSQRRGVAYIGSYKHRPNVDAALWLIDEIMPRARRLEPSLPCLLAGPDLPPEIADRCRDGSVALGRVDDLANVFERVRLTVAPLAYGAGVKGKVVDSLAAGVPCVCTSIAAEGLDLPAALLARVSDTADGVAAAIVRLHQDEAEAERCARAGLDYIAERFSEAAVDAALRRRSGSRRATLRGERPAGHAAAGNRHYDDSAHN